MQTEERNQHASTEDPLERRIRDLIKEHVYSTEGSREMLEKADAAQRDYFRLALGLLDSPGAVYNETQDLLTELAKITNSKVVEGKELIDKLPKSAPVFAVLNHFSIHKLTTIKPHDIGLSKEDVEEEGFYTSEIHPFPLHYASLAPVSDMLNDRLVDAHLEYPGDKLKRLQNEAGLITVPVVKGQFELIKQRTREVFDVHPDSLVVIFPEGGTSGKRNNGTPFDTEPFHSGVWAIARDLAKERTPIPILTTYQYWNPDSGFEVGAVDLFTVKPDSSDDELRKQVDVSREKMQAGLNKRMGRT